MSPDFLQNNIWGSKNIPRYISYTYWEGWSRNRKEAKDRNLSIPYSRESVRIKTHDGRQPVDECPVFNSEYQHLQSGPSPANEYIVVSVDDCVGVLLCWGWCRVEVLIAVHLWVCMSSYVDQYIVIIGIMDTNWSVWNFNQDPRYVRYTQDIWIINVICCLRLWRCTWWIILVVS